MMMWGKNKPYAEREESHGTDSGLGVFDTRTPINSVTSASGISSSGRLNLTMGWKRKFRLWAFSSALDLQSCFGACGHWGGDCWAEPGCACQKSRWV